MSLREGEIIVPPGQTILRQGELTSTAYFWSGGGQVRVTIDGKTVRERTYDPKEHHFFGDLTAILGGPCANTVETLTPNRFIPIQFTPGSIETSVARHPDVACRWLESLAHVAHDALSLVHERELDLTLTQAEVVQHSPELLAEKVKWLGAIYLARRLAEHYRSPVLAGLAGYYENLGMFSAIEGDAAPDLAATDTILETILQEARKHP